MKFHIVLLVLGLCALLVTAKPGGKKDKSRKGHDRRGSKTPGEGRTGGEGGRPTNGRGGKPGRGSKPGSRGRPDHDHDDTPDVVDPACESFDCEKPTRNTTICGTDGETYRSECFLLKDKCRGKVTADVEVASEGRCERPRDGGRPRGEGKRPSKGGKRPGGRGKGDRKPPRGRWPKECWDIWATEEPVTTPGVEADGAFCTASCPVGSPDYPLQHVCGSDDKTYESPCILELVACVTNNMELTAVSDGPCQ